MYMYIYSIFVYPFLCKCHNICIQRRNINDRFCYISLFYKSSTEETLLSSSVEDL